MWSSKSAVPQCSEVNIPPSGLDVLMRCHLPESVLQSEALFIEAGVTSEAVHCIIHDAVTRSVRLLYTTCYVLRWSCRLLFICSGLCCSCSVSSSRGLNGNVWTAQKHVKYPSMHFLINQNFFEILPNQTKTLCRSRYLQRSVRKICFFRAI